MPLLPSAAKPVILNVAFTPSTLTLSPTFTVVLAETVFPLVVLPLTVLLETVFVDTELPDTSFFSSPEALPPPPPPPPDPPPPPPGVSLPVSAFFISHSSFVMLSGIEIGIRNNNLSYMYHPWTPQVLAQPLRYIYRFRSSHYLCI